MIIYPDLSRVSDCRSPLAGNWKRICGDGSKYVKTKEVLSHWQPLNFDDMWDSPNAMKLQFYVYNTHFPVSQWALFLALGESHCTSVEKYSAIYCCRYVPMLVCEYHCCALLYPPSRKTSSCVWRNSHVSFQFTFPVMKSQSLIIESQFSVIQMLNNQFPPDISQQLRCCSVDLV